MTERGFNNPSHDTAYAFRQIMNAMARPGRISHFEPDVVAPHPLHRGTAAVALTLCDFQSPIWISPELDNPGVKHYLRFHAGATLTQSQSDASFAIMSSIAPMPHLEQFAQGSHEYPDRSTTLLIQVPSLLASGACELSGPGLATPRRFSAEGLSPEFCRQMSSNNQNFPLGVDVIFISPIAIAAIPRSTAIRFLETVECM